MTLLVLRIIQRGKEGIIREEEEEEGKKEWEENENTCR